LHWGEYQRHTNIKSQSLWYISTCYHSMISIWYFSHQILQIHDSQLVAMYHLPYYTTIGFGIPWIDSIANLNSIKFIGRALSLLIYPTIVLWYSICLYQSMIQSIALSSPHLLSPCLLNFNCIWIILLLYSNCDAIPLVYLFTVNWHRMGFRGLKGLTAAQIHLNSQKIKCQSIYKLQFADTVWVYKSCNCIALAYHSVDEWYQTRWYFVGDQRMPYMKLSAYICDQ